jgi:hypothetical protein
MARPWRLFWLLVIGFHAVVGAGLLWLTPGGFPWTHLRFLSNWVVPIAILGLVTGAVIAARRQRLDVLRAVLVAFPVSWAAAAISGRVLFPISLRWLFALPLLGAAVMAAVWFATFRRQTDPFRGRAWGLAALATVVGAVLPLSQRAPAPDTQPLDVAMPEAVSGMPVPSGRLSSRLWIHPGDGSITVKAGALTLSVQPMLRFLDRSPDGCWTILVPPWLREEPHIRLVSAGRQEGWLSLRYRTEGEARLRVAPDEGRGPIRLESYTHLSRSIDSHLNGFCDIDVSGHRRLFLSFSPCPDRRIEVRPADYPVGRPMRVAYLGARGGFHVVEASSGEKGPFRELAGGRLGRSEPLAITFHDGDRPLARLTLDDFAAQAGTTLSPTAGWGLPVNAIEFSLAGDAPSSAAAIYITLAGTSVGRGWDSVGHAAGTYRNRIAIDVLDVSQ